MRVLLVDQLLALPALEGGILAVRPHWSVTATEDPAAGLLAATTQRFDVIAVGWRVGRVFGPDLMRRLQAISPESLRILLLPPIIDRSDAAREVLSCAQQCLRKPVAPREFVQATERLAAMRWILSDTSLRSLLGRVDRLPSPPRLYLELQSATQSGLPLTSIARLVGTDPGLAMRVLRIANSALFNRGAPVMDLAQAVNRIGLNVLSQIVLSCETFQKGPPGVDVEALRRTSLGISQLARRMLPDGEQGQLAATAALLADGVRLLPREITGATLGHVRAPEPWNGLPTEALVAAYLLGIWGMPCPLIEAVAFCRDPGRIGNTFSPAGAVHVARALVAGEPLDADYVESADIADRLPHWRRLAADVAPQPVTALRPRVPAPPVIRAPAGVAAR